MTGREAAACTRVLFVGNSYTYVNDLPATFASWRGRRPRRRDRQGRRRVARRWREHVRATAGKLAAARWGFVVLQEQSEIPSSRGSATGQMVPAARSLVGLVRAAGAAPRALHDLGPPDGWPETGLPDYAACRRRSTTATSTIAGRTHAAVAPVGYAWSDAWLHATPRPRSGRTTAAIRPSAGTYLAACVFYAAIFQQSPEGLGYRAGLPKDETAAVQTVAAQVVLVDPARWVR